MTHEELAIMPAQKFEIVVYGRTEWKFHQKEAMRFWFWKMLGWLFTLGWAYRRQVISFEGVAVPSTDTGFTNVWMRGEEADAFLIPGHRPSSEMWTGVLMPENARIYFITVNTRDLKRLSKENVK